MTVRSRPQSLYLKHCRRNFSDIAGDAKISKKLRREQIRREHMQAELAKKNPTTSTTASQAGPAAAAAAATTGEESVRSPRSAMGLLVAVGATGFVSWFIGMSERGEGIRYEISRTFAWRWLAQQWNTMTQPLADPIYKKVLPDWPYIPGTPEGLPCPRTLVLDLEGTLVTSTWDPNFGWRHAKRPGVDDFLKEMSRHYEIVVFSNNILGVADDIVTRLDKHQVVLQRLSREHSRFLNGKYVKDLSHLNRNMGRIIIIDDDPSCFSLQPENAIHIKPFKNAHDKSDTALEDIAPFLRAVSNEEVKDIRTLIRAFPDNRAETIAQSYNGRLLSIAQSRDLAQTRGLGGALRSMGGSLGRPPADRLGWRNEAHPFGDMGEEAESGAVPVRSVVTNEPAVPKRASAGASPLPEERKGKLWQWGASVRARKEEESRKKNEAWGQWQQDKQKQMESEQDEIA